MISTGPLRHAGRSVWAARLILGLGAVLLALSSVVGARQVYEGLISRPEYSNPSRKTNYALELHGSEGALLYYGGFHRVDPRDPQFDDIEAKWVAFRPTFALSEGCIWPLADSREEAIRLYGEQGLLRFLASRDGVPISSLDPPLSCQLRFLRRFHQAHEIRVFYVLRQACIHRMLKKDRLELRKYAERFLRDLSLVRGYQTGPSSLDDFRALVAALFPELGEWENVTERYFYDPEVGQFLSTMHSRLNEYRDRFMIRTLMKKLKKGHRVFAVVGRIHVLRQEPVLRTHLG